jgi:hypothetical protein
MKGGFTAWGQVLSYEGDYEGKIAKVLGSKLAFQDPKALRPA